MTEKSNAYKVRLGMFISIGILFFFLAIFFIGKQKNLFDPTFALYSDFYNVSGLKVGNVVRFSGINVGTVEEIKIVNDSTVRVQMQVKKDVQEFIRTDSQVAIGSEGVIGNRLLTISSGSTESKIVKEGQKLTSSEPIETDAIFQSLAITADNAAVATDEITEILHNINSGKGTLGRLIRDTIMAKNIDKTIVNLKTSTNKLDQNMEAAKHNFLLRGYFKKKEKEKQEKAEEAKKAAENAKKEAEKKQKEKSDK